MSVTRDDVAKLAGVSPATVSYVVNNGPRPVSPETRQRVLWAIEQLNYTPSAIARSLKTSQTHTIGLIISDILNPFLASIVKSTEDLLLARDYGLIVVNSDESPERELCWLRMLLRRRMDGLIVFPTGHNRSFLFSTVQSGRTLVLIDRQIAGLEADCVLMDNECGAYEGVTHLIGQGHTRIGLLNIPSTITPGQGRLHGYQKALHDAGLSFSPQLVREGGLVAEGKSSGLAGELLDLHPPPTALFAASNRVAAGVLRQVKARGLRMPDDLALCVFDDVPYYSISDPSITAVAVDPAELAGKAIEYVIERITQTYTGEPRTTLVSCCLRVRESTGGQGVLEEP